MKSVVVIRDRGQLTIPDTIRKAVSWVTPMSAVTISVTKPDEITIKPNEKIINWDKLWKQIRRVRAFKGKGQGNLSEFIVKDRESHF
ncbi:MAG: hypothetical protein HYV40_05610 [Candidatus Levybacteria bacterium]|nr:hypothetical protein [Candidatus Levybacteria bacterium]